MVTGLKRRSFVRGLGWLVSAGAGSLAASSCDRVEDTSDGTTNQGTGSLLATAVRAHFPYLEIPDEVVDAFVRDFEAAYGAWRPRAGSAPFTRFLASSDFFQNGADESRPLRYVRLFDPYASPCYNPFSEGG